MKTSFAILLLISLMCGFLAPGVGLAQSKKDTQEPPPAVTSFQGRPVYAADHPDINPPQVLSAPDPPPLKDFSAGTVVLWCIVAGDGKPYMIKIARHLSMEADMKAAQNLKEWKFSPGVTRKKNEVVNVLMKVDVVWR
jgi:hypothetical protein